MRKLINEEIGRIQEIMGVKKSILLEQPVGEFFSKELGVTGDEVISRLEKSGTKYAESLGNEFMQMIKKSVLNPNELKFVSSIVRKAFPESIEKFVSNMESNVFRNSPELLQIDKLLVNPNIPTDQMVNIIKQTSGAKLTPEAVQLWRDYKMEKPKPIEKPVVEPKKDVIEPKNELKGKIVNMQGIELFHGTNFEIKDPSELDPLFRDSEAYKARQADPRTKSNTGSSGNYGTGVGVYFGRSETKMGPSDARQYMRNSQYLTHGNVYKMTLKPDAKVLESNIHIQTISKEQFNFYRSQGIDAVTNGTEVNLINPKAVATWVKVDEWNRPFIAQVRDFNPTTRQMETLKQETFMDLASLEKFYQTEMKTNEPIILKSSGTERIYAPNSDKQFVVRREVEHEAPMANAAKVAKPVERGEVLVTGTAMGLQDIYGKVPEFFPDFRDNRKPSGIFFQQFNLGDKKIFSLVDWNIRDYGNRPGYIATSISVDKNALTTLSDVKADLEALHTRTMSGIDKEGKINKEKVREALKGVNWVSTEEGKLNAGAEAVQNVLKPVIPNMDVTIEGTTSGYKVLSGNKENAIGDIRTDAWKAKNQGKQFFTKETVKGDKKIFSLVDAEHYDDFGRAGFKAASVAVPLNSATTINDVLPTLQAALKKGK